MNEYIRPIKEYEDVYSVCANGDIIENKTGKIIKPYKAGRDYLYVCLLKNGKAKQKRVHRLVAEAFIPNIFNKPQVNHINGNKNDNQVWNLEWCNNAENMKHAYATGLRKSHLIKIVETGETFRTAVEVAKRINGSVGNIYSCLSGRRKTHKGYHFEEIGEK